MTTATEIIAYLRARQPAHVVEKTTGLPHGWGIWLRNAPVREGRLTYEPVGQVTAAAVDAMRARPVVVVPMTRWRAARSLLWQHDVPPPREERGTRWAGRLGSLALHVGFLLILLLVSGVNLPPPSPEDEAGRIQLTFIGRGTSGEGGGAGAQAPQVQTASSRQVAESGSGRQASAAPAARRPTASQATSLSVPAPLDPSGAVPAQPAPQSGTSEAALPPPPPVADSQPTPPQPQPPTPAPQEQPLQVTETPQPTQAFVLAPVTPPQVTLPSPSVSLPQAQVRLREVETVETQQPVAVRQVTPRALQAPVLEAKPTQVRHRDIPMPEPVPALQVPAMAQVRPVQHAAAPVQLETAPAQVRIREVPSPPAGQVAEAQQQERAPTAPESASSQADASAQVSAMDASAVSADAGSPASTATSPTSASAPADASAPAQPTRGTPGAPVAGRGSSGDQAAMPGAGAARSDAWGAPGQQVADDWGAASKASQGDAVQQGARGLFNADGSAKVPDDLAGGGSTVKPGVPGSRQQARFDADQAGTWLDRPNIGYAPTMFDKYWIPGGTLLQDWVRRGVREMEIPVPGTSKRIRCVISVLQAGGACGLYDPNKVNQPATARPPPDIPVKRHPIPVGS